MKKKNNKTFKFNFDVSKQKEEEYNFLNYLGNIQIESRISLLNQFLNRLWCMVLLLSILLIIIIIGVYK